MTIRLAQPDEWDAIDRLAQLDSSPPPPREPILVGEVDGELRAAVSLRNGHSIANPFRRTVEVVELLRARATQLRSVRAVHTHESHSHSAGARPQTSACAD